MEGKSQNGVLPVRTNNTTGRRPIPVDSIDSLEDHQSHFVRTWQAKNLRSNPSTHAPVVKRSISSKGQIASTHVEINSRCLSRVLQDIIPDAEYLALGQEKSEVTGETLWHVRPALRARLDRERVKDHRARDNVVISDIEAALDFLQEEYATTKSQLTELERKGLITYDLLWCLFPPSVEVYTHENALHEPQVLRCKSYSYQEDERTGQKSFAVHSECLNHDGQSFGWSEQVLQIPFFKGTALVTSLLAYPLAYYPDQKGLRDSLRSRGKTFVGLLAGPTCREYGAMALISSRAGSGWQQDALRITGCVMVDPDRFPKADSPSDPLRQPSCPGSKAFPPAETPEKDLMFCHYRIIGFTFDRKRWAALAVSQLRDPEWNDKALDRVMMPLLKRELMRSLMLAQRAGDEGQGRPGAPCTGEDRGLIGLLSGGPGLGKTMTAEAAAEVSRRPLYAVSAGELGADVSEVDRRLEEVLGLASSWKCLLLIEECDVFLQRRDSVSLVNNALVSIFMRRLECFQGLAILTTNAIGNVDPALLSRLHFKFHYEDLGSKQRLVLLKSSLGPVKTLDEASLEKVVADYEMNGHEIKIAASCAKLIAQSRGIALTAGVLRGVLDELSDHRNTTNAIQRLPAGYHEGPKQPQLGRATVQAAQQPTQDAANGGKKDTKDLTEEEASALATVRGSNTEVKDRKSIFRKVRPSREDGRPSRENGYGGSADKMGGPDKSVEALMRNTRENYLSLDAGQIFRLTNQDQADKINQAVKARALDMTEHSGKDKRHGLAAGFTFICLGSGNLNVQFGNGNMYNVSGGATVNKAEHMSFARKPVSTV